jgi:hypothetical protein
MPTRREFLTATAGLVGSAAASDTLLRLTPLSATEAALTPDLVQLTPDIEPIVRLIEQTPREKCFEVIAEQLRGGLPYRQFLAGLYLAGIRNVNPQPPGFKFHCVFVIHAAHQMSLDAPVQDRLLPLFWALDNFKASQQKDIDEGDFQLAPVTGKLPSAESAAEEFHAAMWQWDEEKADRAITALVRTSSAHRVIELLWRYGARDYRNIGHKAIFVANTWRTLQTIGWKHAEPALRSLVLGLLDFGKSERVNDYTFASQSFRSNSQLARDNIEALRGDWTTPTQDSAATKTLLEVMRSGNAEDACQQAFTLLKDGKAGAPQIWDAVHLAAGELMMQQPGIFGIHTVTSAHALRYAYETASYHQTRLLMVLQGVGWMCHFQKFMAGRPQGLKELKITELEADQDAPANGVTADEIFALVGQDSELAGSKAMAFAQANPVPTGFTRTANRLLLKKATDAHDYKYAASIFDDYNRVSPQWRPHMLATATYYLRGNNSPDSAVMQRAAEVISTL